MKIEEQNEGGKQETASAAEFVVYLIDNHLDEEMTEENIVMWLGKFGMERTQCNSQQKLK